MSSDHDNPTAAAGDGYARWLQQNPPASAADLERRRRLLGRQPLFSILMPVKDPMLRHLRAAITSVQNQSYGRWELCMVDDCSRNEAVRHQLEDARRSDERLKVGVRDQPGHICRASNDALALCEGEFVALLDHDDLLHPEALQWVAEAIDRQGDLDLLFTDEDKIDDGGRRFGPHFKHRLNLDILWSQNFVSHLGVYRRRLVEEAGGFRVGFEGSQDHDLALRVLERSSLARACHIPRVLYHWRVTEGSTAAVTGAKAYASQAGIRAVSEHLARTGHPAEVASTVVPGVYRVRHRSRRPAASVALIMVGGEGPGLHVEAVSELARSLRRLPMELVVAATPEQFSRLKGQTADRYSQHVWHNVETSGVSEAALRNAAAAACTAELLVFAAPYLRPRPGAAWATAEGASEKPEDWLLELAANLTRPEIGVVGGRVVDCHGRVDSCGMALGTENMVGKLQHGLDLAHPGYMYRAVVAQEVSVVSAALLGIRRQTLDELGGFDPRFRDDYYDVDLCLRARRRGLKVLATPFSTLQMSHGITGRAPVWKAGLMLLLQKHLRALQAEPFISEHLILHQGVPGIRVGQEEGPAGVDGARQGW